MVRTVARIGVLLALVPALVPGQPILPAALEEVAATEREFARTATVKGWRDAFLDFFADDAIAFAPEVVGAKDRLRKQPSTPFTENELVWEPRTGDVAASGDLAWLTGPSTSINHKTADKRPRHGCYLSVWRKQPDGRWRVFIDVGIAAPAPVPFEPGLTRTGVSGTYAGGEGKSAATRSLAQADGELNAAIAADGNARAFSARVTTGSRLHRPGMVPVVGRDAIERHLQQHETQGSARATSAEVATAGDLGYTYGTFDVVSPKPATGVYVRLWNRDASGRWWLMADVAQVFKR